MILVAVRGQADIGLLHRFAKAGRIKPVRVRSSRPLLILWLNASVGVYIDITTGMNNEYV